jgi:glutathione reductase (NADPH)
MISLSLAPAPAVCAPRVSAASHGARVAIAEEYRVGGTCVIRGCVPKKLLVYASRLLALSENENEKGLRS